MCVGMPGDWGGHRARRRWSSHGDTVELREVGRGIIGRMVVFLASGGYVVRVVSAQVPEVGVTRGSGTGTSTRDADGVCHHLP